MGATTFGVKDGWRCCDTCNGFYIDGSGNACVGGGSSHANTNGGRGGVTGGSVPGWQDNWRTCKKCGSLFYYGSPTNGSCFKSGAHEYENTNGYSLEMRSAKPSSVGYHNMWRWCHKCECLFYGGNSKMGSCPNGGSHDASKSNYYAIQWTP